MNNEYKTTDLGFVAALIATEINPIQILEDNPKRQIFVFDNVSSRITELYNLYVSNDLFVPAQQYFIQLKLLKAKIRHDQDNRGR